MGSPLERMFVYMLSVYGAFALTRDAGLVQKLFAYIGL